MFLCGFPTELANIIDFAQAKSNKKIGQTRFSSTCFESRLSLKGGVTCRDTPFTIEKLSCSGSTGEPRCQSFETQICDDPKPEQVCADLTQVECRPETINICKTIVHTVDKEECLEFKEPECKEYSEKMCYNGYSPGDCKVTTEEECHYVTKPCPYNTYNGCTPTKERVCNHISKPKCTGAGASIQCTTLTNLRCTVTPVTCCVNVLKSPPVNNVRLRL